MSKKKLDNQSLNLVMNTFSGRYVTERGSRNIAHENMNFFKPDNYDKFFLWFNSNGNIPEKYLDYDGNITLMMVTNFANEKDKFRILALAKNCHIIPEATITARNIDEKNEIHNKFLERFPRIDYGANTLQGIYSDNSYKGEHDYYHFTFWTESSNIFVPENETLTITINNIENADIKQNMSNESMRMYINDNSSFNQLVTNIRWLPFDKKSNIIPHFSRNSSNYKNDTFFTMTGNEKDELTLSNTISYSLKNSNTLLENFISTLTNKTIKSNNIEYSIQREDKHVDLSLTMDDFTMIIENKIDSFIVEKGYETKADLENKVKKTYKEYLNDGNKYDSSLSEKIVNKINSLLNGIDENFKCCQLTKYYIQSKIDAIINHRENFDIFYYLLVPNYAKNKFVSDDNGFVIGWNYSNKYKLITYNDLYKIFNIVEEYSYKDDILKEFKMLASDIDDSDQKRLIYDFLKKAGL